MQRMLDRLGRTANSDGGSNKFGSNPGLQHQQNRKLFSTDDCGWCEEFDNGPCHVPFRLWMQCCDLHPEDYPEACKKQLLSFQKCLETAETSR
jgi:hypothetical protein